MTRFIVCILLTLMLATPVMAEGQPELLVATEGAYPPFNYIDEEGQPAGFDVDIARAICDIMNRDCRIVTAPWEQLLPRLADDEFDMVVASVAKTEERDRIVDFTIPYYRSRSNFVARTGRFPDASRKTFSGTIIVAQRGTVQAEYVRKNYPESELVTADSTKAAFKMLVDGKADAMLSDSLTIYDFLQTPEGRDFDYTGAALPADNVSSHSHIAVNEGDDKLRKEINRAIRLLKAEGLYDRINKRYFPFSIY